MLVNVSITMKTTGSKTLFNKVAFISDSWLCNPKLVLESPPWVLSVCLKRKRSTEVGNIKGHDSYIKAPKEEFHL